MTKGQQGSHRLAQLAYDLRWPCARVHGPAIRGRHAPPGAAPGRRLAVGPQSAGSTPGPACYGHGGREPTVTDANLVLGRLNPARFLGGELTLDTEAPRRA